MKRVDILGFPAELKRKIIHLSCTVLPLMYYFVLSREHILILSSSISILFIFFELLRFKHRAGGKLFRDIFGPLLREEEFNHVTGATYLFVSATISFLIFSKDIAVAAVLIMTIADSFAAVVGKITVSPKFISKSVAGSVTFLIISTILIFLIFPNIGIMAMIVVIPVTILEAIHMPVNDNLVIAIISGFLLNLIV